MNPNQLTGASFPEANGTLSGRPLTVTEGALSDKSKVDELPVFRDGVVIVSKWRLASFWARLKFLFTGDMYVIVLGMSQPPLSLRVDNPFDNPENEHQ